MQVTVHRRVEVFLARTQALLEADEPSSTMLLGVCLELLRRSTTENPGALNPDAAVSNTTPESVFVIVEDAAEVALVGVQTPPYGLIVHPRGGLSEKPRRTVVEAFLDAWTADGLRLTNVLGPKAWSQELAAAWAARQGMGHSPRLRMRLYALHQVVPPRPRTGVLRRADLGDEALVRAWFHAFNREALNLDAAAASHAMAGRRLAAGEIYLWQEDMAMSMAARSRATETSVSVGHVYTPPALRGQGSAACCVAALSQRLLDEGFERCTLFTDLRNRVSNRIYQRLGYRPLDDYYEMVFSSQG